MEMEQCFEILKVISDETRFAIIRLLLNRDFCVKGLARELGLSEPAISQHMQILRKSGLIEGEKRGYFMHYTVNSLLLKEAGQVLSLFSDQAARSVCRKNISGECSCACEKALCRRQKKT